jgi:hypothetical protein
MDGGVLGKAGMDRRQGSCTAAQRAHARSSLPEINGRNPAAPTAGIVIFLLSLAAADLLRSWASRIGSLADLDYQVLPVRVSMILRGAPFYGDFRHPPYVPLPYPPTIPWLVVGLSRLFGVSASGSLEVGRLLTISSTIAVCILIVVLAVRWGCSRSAAIIVSLAFLISPLVQLWGYFFRVDMPAMACELGGLCAFVLGFQFLAVALFVLVFFIKQFRVAGIAAVVVFCWLSGKRRQALILSGVWLTAIVLLTGMLEVLIPNYWLNTGAALASFRDLKAIPDSFRHLALFAPGLIAVAAITLTRKRSLTSLPLCFLIAALAENTATLLHWGSAVYYLLPTLVAATPFAAEGLDRLLEQAANLSKLAQIGFAGAITLSLCPWWVISERGPIPTYQAVLSDIGRHPPPSPWDEKAMDRLSSIHGMVITDMNALAVANPYANVEFIELMVFDTMRVYGLFDDGPLLASVQSRKIGGFALDRELLERDWRGRKLFWPALSQAISQNYELVRDQSGRAVGPPFLMVPKAGGVPGSRAVARLP